MRTLSLIPVPINFSDTYFQLYRQNDTFVLAEVLGQLPSLTAAPLLLRFSISQGWYYILPHYETMVLVFIYFSILPVLYSLVLLQFITLYPVRSCDSAKN